MLLFCVGVLAVHWSGPTGQVAGAEESLEQPSNQTLRVGLFDVDASPPIGSLMAYDPVKGVEVPLSCRGVVLLGAEQPIVLCAVDWIGIGNDGHKIFREALAEAAGTTPERVSVHALHQHDAPRCDFSVERILKESKLPGGQQDADFCRRVIGAASDAVRKAVQEARPVNRLGLGEAEVEKVASNRRIPGPDGNVKYTRFTATKNAEIRAMPVGTIDPKLKLITFYHDDQPVAVLTYYATHPQSYYRTGLANPDFPGLARNARQQETGVPHIHFNGAGGNIGAGKWNDGARENRQVLADRVADGMRRAWENQQQTPLAATDVGWESTPVLLPVGSHIQQESLEEALFTPDASPLQRHSAANRLAWLKRCQAQDPIHIGCLRVKNARVLHMPGELFVEYQLQAQNLRPDLFVAMAAYGDYAPGYIGTEIAYSQGGYETSNRASAVAPEVEQVLVTAMKKLLQVEGGE